MTDLVEFGSAPGVKRDGSPLDSVNYLDAVWVRFQRGKPRKIGGYRAMSRLANAPVRSILVDSRNNINSAHYFSQWGVQRQQFSSSGAGGNLEDRTPLSFVTDPTLTWSHSTMYSSTGGTYSALLAAATPDINDISSDVPGRVYSGDISTSAPLVTVSDGSGPIAVSGGLCVLQPFLFVYGSNGLIRNSNANDFSTATGWTTGGSSNANSANVAGTKFVHGAPTRGGGQSPAGLFWALDALVRVSFVGGTALWNYDTLSSPTSVLSKKAIVEHDGKFYWPGSDRFLFYNGVVQELPNIMSHNYFFDNLNYTCRNKVWGTKIPRWGEIWWFYPAGADTECGNAVIYNYREDTWYDAVKKRSAGGSVQVFPFPIWAGAEDAQNTTLLQLGLRLATNGTTAIGNNVLHFASTAGVANGMLVTGDPGIPAGTTVSSFAGTTVNMSNNATILVASGVVLTFSSTTHAFTDGQLATGVTSGATGTVVRSTDTTMNLINVTGTFVSGEVVTGASSASTTVIAAPLAQELDAAYQHEFGVDKVLGQDTTAIPASFTTKDFGYATGQLMSKPVGQNNNLTRIARMEPDLKQVGALTLTVIGRDYPADPPTVQFSEDFLASSSFEDLRVQSRLMRLQVSSNVLGGNFELGKTLCEFELGDARSNKQI